MRSIRADKIYLHGLTVTCLFEDLRSHVARSTAGCSQDMELLLIHDPRQAKIRYQQVCIVFGCSEQQILWLEVSVDNSMVVQICHGGQSGSN